MNGIFGPYIHTYEKKFMRENLNQDFQIDVNAYKKMTHSDNII